MTKDEAQREAIKRWRARPVAERLTHQQARDFSAVLAEQLHFHTMGDERRVIEAWLVRDIETTTGPSTRH